MKKRKPPVVLASVLIVLIGAAVIMNLPKNEDEHKEDRDPNDAVPTGQARQAPSAKEVRQMLSAEEKPVGPAEAPVVTGANTEMATVFLPKAKPMTQPPAPNDTSISTQWYRDNARKAAPGKS